ncbi:hypothetical protein HPB50_020274 [Hyalomma asiaticum]|uniref:Uncharacterized protein n=1 Tax=Hyalomma asiaticum TaxID=266040 RepID=A0ACB7RKM2_HYAAI|nr:hypothetical protein HPB50_020274 [Hyalomma asiaticum]
MTRRYGLRDRFFSGGLSFRVDSPYRPVGADGGDGMPPVDANAYATRKTVAQGCLDVALLTMNAAQLKHTLEQGTRHQFYTLVTVLAFTSIAVQAVVAIMLILLGCLDLGNPNHRRTAVILNNVATAFMVAVTMVNILSAAFDMAHSDYEPLTNKVFPSTELYDDTTTQSL